MKSRGRAGWRNPSFDLRVVLVGAVWLLPGAFFGLMAAIVAPVTDDPSLASAVGGSLFAMAGAALEAFG